MSSDILNSSIKVVLAGSSGVGKTSILSRLIDNSFCADNQPTIGVEFKSYSVTVEQKRIKLQIWDTAGQERFRSVSKAYFRNSLGAILVFDLTQRESFDDLTSWLRDLENLGSPNSYIILVGNKSDLTSDRQVSENEAQEFAIRHGILYLETSAKDGFQVAEAFSRLANGILLNIKKGKLTVPKKPENSVEGKKLDFAGISDYGQKEKCSC